MYLNINVNQGAVGTDHHLKQQESAMKAADAQPPASQSPGYVENGVSESLA
jgi:hypothetical protein